MAESLRFRLRLKAKASVPAEGEAPCKVARSDVGETSEPIAAPAAVVEGAAKAQDSVNSAPTSPIPASVPATEASEAPVPSEVAVASAPAEDAGPSISERKLQAEVQAILATDVQDLAQTTMGQMRRALEERLGLTAGSLGKRKQLRRRISRIVQEEVVRKVSRTQSIDRIVRALVEFEGYPAEVRDMLINCLPRSGPDTAFPLHRSPSASSQTAPDAAVAVAATSGDAGVAPLAEASRPMHPHQVSLLGIVRDALHESRGLATEAAEKNLERVKVVEVEIFTLKAECSAAASAQLAAQARADTAAARTKELEQALIDAGLAAERATAASAGAGAEEFAVARRRDFAAGLRGGSLKMLLEGSWEDTAKRDAAIADVVPYFKEERADDALVLAAPAALRKRPHERSSFDNLAVQSMSQLLDSRIAAADVRLASGIQAAADTERMTAGVILEATRARAERQALEDADARAAAVTAAEARRVAEAALASRWSGTKDLCAEGDQLRAKLQELDELLVILGRWIETRTLSEPGAEALAAVAAEAPSAEEPAAEEEALGASMEVKDETMAPAAMEVEDMTLDQAKVEEIVNLLTLAHEGAVAEADAEALGPAAEGAVADGAPVLPLATSSEGSSEERGSEDRSSEQAPTPSKRGAGEAAFEATPSPGRSSPSEAQSPAPAHQVETPAKSPGAEPRSWDGINAKCLGA